MIVDEVRAVLARVTRIAVVTLAGLSLFAPGAYAQEDEETEDETAARQTQRQMDEVVVTGSRIKRDTYTSIAPLQVITSQISREVGLRDDRIAGAGWRVDRLDLCSR